MHANTQVAQLEAELAFERHHQQLLRAELQRWHAHSCRSTLLMTGGNLWPPWRWTLELSVPTWADEAEEGLL